MNAEPAHSLSKNTFNMMEMTFLHLATAFDIDVRAVVVFELALAQRAIKIIEIEQPTSQCLDLRLRLGVECTRLHCLDIGFNHWD